MSAADSLHEVMHDCFAGGAVEAQSSAGVVGRCFTGENCHQSQDWHCMCQESWSDADQSLSQLEAVGTAERPEMLFRRQEQKVCNNVDTLYIDIDTVHINIDTLHIDIDALHKP